MSKRTKYSSNSISISSQKSRTVPTLFSRYYSWLTNASNLYNATIGAVVKMFCMFGESDVDPRIPTSKGIYVEAIENIAIGIIRSCTNEDALGLYDYINYQIKGISKLYPGESEDSFKTRDMEKLYRTLFFIQDLDNDGRLNVEDLAVSIAYLDMKDGVLNGKFRYEDAISLGEDISTEVGRFQMRMELNNLKTLLYGKD